MRVLLKPSAVLLVTGALAVFGLVAAGVALGAASEQGLAPSRAGMRSEVAGVTPPCPVEACMALTVSESGVTCADAVCTVSNGEKFTLAVVVEVAPATGYIGAQTWIEFGSDLTYNMAPIPADEIVWPDCVEGVALRGPRAPDTHVWHGCVTSLTPPLPVSTYTGNLVELSFTCSSGPSSTELLLVPLDESPAGNGGASFAVPGDPLSDPPVPSEVVVPSVRNLTVQCTAATATPTGTLSATPASSATPMPTGGATVTPPGTPTFTPTGTPATPTLTPTGTPATPTFTPTGTPATPVGAATATPVAPGVTPATRTPTPGPSPTPTPAPILVGDANCDGNVDPIDAAFILQWSARMLAALPCPADGDASGDGGVDPLDALLILQFSSRLIGTLPP